MQYWQNGVESRGSFIDIRPDHAIFVGQCVFDEKWGEKMMRKGTVYFPDGTSDGMED